MAAKKKADPTKDKQSVAPPTPEGADYDLAVGRTYLKPTVTAALTMRTWNNTLPVDGLHGALAEQIEKVARDIKATGEAVPVNSRLEALE